VINAAMARRFWGVSGSSTPNSPIGRRLRYGRPGDPWRTIVGVVGDVPSEDVARPARPAFFLPLAQAADAPRNLAVVVRAPQVAPDALAATVRATIAAIDPELPVYRIRTLDGIVKDSLGGKRLAAVLMGGFAAAALLLSAVGLAGSVAYSVARRAREIGVRVALGARPADVRALFLREGIPVFAAGAAAGLAAAWATGAAVRSVLDWTSSPGPILYFAIVLVLAAVEIGATLLPARRATRLDPAAVMQPE
jgi:predicted lysophospholipase L1 biosynthesis ABC-type transport system permease subunit